MKSCGGFLLLLMVLGLPVKAMAEDQVKLFKFITPKDDVVVGLTTTELQAFGSGPDLDKLAKHLAADGQMTLWQFAVRRDQSGTLQEAPLRRIAVFKADTLRIEPYTTPYPIVAPEK